MHFSDWLAHRSVGPRGEDWKLRGERSERGGYEGVVPYLYEHKLNEHKLIVVTVPDDCEQTGVRGEQSVIVPADCRATRFREVVTVVADNAGSRARDVHDDNVRAGEGIVRRV